MEGDLSSLKNFGHGFIEGQLGGQLKNLKLNDGFCDILLERSLQCNDD